MSVFIICLLLCIDVAVSYYCEYVNQCSNTTLSVQNDYITCQTIKSCYNSNLTASEQIACYGPLSCGKSQVKSQEYNYEVDCWGSGSCESASIKSYTTLDCTGLKACANGNLSFTDSSQKGLVRCNGMQSCANSSIVSSSSQNDETFNSRTIYMVFLGAFSGYNSSIISNGNDIGVYFYGYYSGYGSTIVCSPNDVCDIYCYGNGCVNIKNLCESQNNCGISYTYSTSGPTTSHYDIMVDVIDSILANYGNYSIMPWNGADAAVNLDFIQTCSYEGLYFTGTQIDPINITDGGAACCLGVYSCNHSVITTGGDVYCDTVACSYSNIIGCQDIYVQGYLGASNSNIKFTNVALMDSMGACQGCTLEGGSVLVCSASTSCSACTIKNVKIIIGLGSYSLSNSTIINATEIYLLGSGAGHGVRIDSGDKLSSNCTIYCQNLGCDGMKTRLFCKDSKYDSMNNSSNQTIGVQACYLTSFKPTASPTYEPTHVPTRVPTRVPTYLPTYQPTYQPSVGSGTGGKLGPHTLDFASFLQNVTLIVTIIVIAAMIILTAVSVKLRKTKHTSRTEMLASMLNGTELESMDNHTMSSNLNESDNRIVHHDSINITRDDGNNIVNYISGFGLQSANHFVITQIILGVYDIYTDVAYLLELLSNGYQISFYLFLSSLILTWIINIFVLGYFLRLEFNNNNNNLFTTWFYQHNGVITILLFVFVLTDVSMISSAFTSQIFGLATFYAPISINGMNIIHVSTIFSILFEHLPQLMIQFYFIMYQAKHFTIVIMAALIVSCIDMLFAVTRVVVWICLCRSKRSS